MMRQPGDSVWLETTKEYSRSVLFSSTHGLAPLTMRIDVVNRHSYHTAAGIHSVI